MKNAEQHAYRQGDKHNLAPSKGLTKAWMHDKPVILLAECEDAVTREPGRTSLSPESPGTLTALAAAAIAARNACTRC